MNRNLNTVNISPLDSRDIVIEDILIPEEFPKSIDLRDQMPVVWDQGINGPCSAYVAAAIKMWQEKKDYGLSEQLSTHFVYNLRYDTNVHGMTPRNTMQILRKHGIPTAKSYRRKKMKLISKIPNWVLEEAINHRILGYAKVNSIDGLKKSIHTNGPAYMSMKVYNESTEFWKKFNGDKLLGGHAVTIVGYNKEGFIIRNSWGRSWNNDGHTIYPYSDWGLHLEIWTVLDEVGSLKIERPSKDDQKSIQKEINERIIIKKEYIIKEREIIVEKPIYQKAVKSRFSILQFIKKIFKSK